MCMCAHGVCCVTRDKEWKRRVHKKASTSHARRAAHSSPLSGCCAPWTVVDPEGRLCPLRRHCCAAMAKNGPKSWSKAKMRQKRPDTHEKKKSHEQVVGKRFFKLTKPEQPLQPAPQPKPQQSAIHKKKRAAPLQRDEKRLRALNKLLREIEALQEQETNGEVLDEQQQAKVDRLDSVLGEMDELMGSG